MKIFGHPMADYVDVTNPKADIMGLALISCVWGGLLIALVGIIVFSYNDQLDSLGSLGGLVGSIIGGPALGHAIQNRGTSYNTGSGYTGKPTIKSTPSSDDSKNPEGE